MGRKISIRIVLVGALFVCVLVVMLCWATLNAAVTGNNFGFLGRFALNIAAYPTLIQSAWIETVDRITGRELYKHLSVPRPDVDLSGFEPVRSADGLPETGLILRVTPGKAARGWRYVGGALRLDGEVSNALALLDPDFTVTRIWHLDEDGVSLSRRADQSRKILHGLAVLPDGSVVAGFDNGSSLQRLDICGNRLWLKEGMYHHAVTYDRDTGTLWALRHEGFGPGPDHWQAGDTPVGGFVQIDAETGRTLREFTIFDVIDANPVLGLFEVARHDFNLENTNAMEVSGYWLGDPMHFNDVQVLSRDLAGAFPQFSAGDLLVSARTLNAVLVIDPETLRVKWHRVGATTRQHDPDWQADGTISVFDNRMSRGPSQIIALDPTTMKREVLFEGAEAGFYTRIRGRHAIAKDGRLIVSSPQQGRAFEVGPDGEIAVELYNQGPEDTGLNLALTEYIWLPDSPNIRTEATCALP